MSALIGGIAVGATALGKGVLGAVQNHKANKIDENNIRPVETVQPELNQNVATAQQMAQIGLPQQQYLNQLNSINRNQAAGVQALGSSQNPNSGVASIVRASNDASNNLNAQDAAARNRNTLALIQQRGLLANAKQNAWNYNYADKYSENLAHSQALRGAAAQNIGGAINSIGQAGIGYMTAGLGGQSGSGQTLGGVDPRLNAASNLSGQYARNGINSQEQAFNKYLGL